MDTGIEPSDDTTAFAVQTARANLGDDVQVFGASCSVSSSPDVSMTRSAFSADDPVEYRGRTDAVWITSEVASGDAGGSLPVADAGSDLSDDDPAPWRAMTMPSGAPSARLNPACRLSE